MMIMGRTATVAGRDRHTGRLGLDIRGIHHTTQCPTGGYQGKTQFSRFFLDNLSFFTLEVRLEVSYERR
jgi:hypothetical protein